MTDTPPKVASLSAAIEPHLPLLRRYARALTGSQDTGDTHVVALLEALLADRSLLPAAPSPRVALYCAFQRMWASSHVEVPAVEGPAGSREAVAQNRLARLSPRSRQALLLNAVEGFTNDETAMIMGCDAEEAARLIDDAVADLKTQIRARVLIIEDEPIIAMDLEALVLEMGHEVAGIADTHISAVEAARADPPDLVLADIQLADGSSGLEAVREILSEMAAPVIFITAYPERLLTGARPEPTFLISKPFQVETVQACISQALFFRETVTMA